MTKKVISALALVMVLLAGITGRAQAQQTAWLQIEAQPTLTAAEDRARAWSGIFTEVTGYQLRSGWYAIALGPYAPDEAVQRLSDLRRENLVPRDSFVADGRNFAQMFWPVGAIQDAQIVPIEPIPEQQAAEPQVTPEAAIAQDPVVLPDESPKEARASESALTQSDRELLQTALKWFGFYASSIDGAFGPGTRNSMAQWQEANAFEPTGILTTMQRTTLTESYYAEQAEFGFQTITEQEAGIEITLPTALVAFDHYEPPFVHYAPKNGGKTRVILISEPGNQSTLFGLYDILQTLEIVPLNGERSRTEKDFTIRAESAQLASYSHAELARGMIKGYILVWDPSQGDRMARVLDVMAASFRPVGDRALDPGLAPMDAAARQSLLSGLEVRKPAFSRSGFYIDPTGTVLTTSDAVDQCARITLDGDTEARVTLSDPATGLAVLTPAQPLAPPATARFRSEPSRIGAEITLSGYSYEGTLSAPVLTFGSLQATEGLDGEQGLARLALTALPGDAGGPVFDAAGSVVGMLLPRATSGSRVLPEGVAFAADGTAIASRLGQNGIILQQQDALGTDLTPDALSALATGMTVLVSCWK